MWQAAKAEMKFSAIPVLSGNYCFQEKQSYPLALITEVVTFLPSSNLFKVDCFVLLISSYAVVHQKMSMHVKCSQFY